LYSSAEDIINNQHDIFLKRIVRYCIFMSLFLCTLCSIGNKEINYLKYGLVILAIIFSFQKMLIVIDVYDITEKINWKHYIGTQRTGFIYVLAFWITYLDFDKIFKYKIKHNLCILIKTIILAIIIFGAFSTYSRSTILAFLSTYLIYISLKNIFLFKLIVLFTAFLIFFYFGLQIIYFDFNPLVLLYELFNLEENTSFGYRVFIWKKIILSTYENIIIGSGFFGISQVMTASSGSAHSQYFDVLYRVGVVGFILYFITIIRMLKFYLKNDLSLFLGFFSMLVIGIFHESIKLPHGTVVAAFLLGYMINKKKYNK
ncbi:O-antigen ligase family protein, partial [Candidatus Pelagibacter sp.]|nr:O-antigen ligase family protein [Candidatus Pelagibacter sp.]